MRLRFLLAFFVAVTVSAPVAAAIIPESKYDDGPGAMETNGSELAVAWISGHVADVDQTLHAWWKERRRFKDGRFEIYAFEIGTAAWFEHDGGSGDWNTTLALVERLQKEHPRSIATALAAAQFWYQWAWSARGTGYAREVSPEAWKVYRERIGKSRQILDSSKRFAADSPLWYYQRLTVAIDSSADDEAFETLFHEATKRYPEFFFFHFVKTRHLTPNWGGDVRSFDAFVKQTVEATRATEGEGMYARLYWSYDGHQCCGNLFEESLAEWPRMRRGFEDLMKRSPDSRWQLNNFASFACRAHDRAVLAKLLVQIGDAPIAQAWPSGYSFDSCRKILIDTPESEPLKSAQ